MIRYESLTRAEKLVLWSAYSLAHLSVERQESVIISGNSSPSPAVLLSSI